ncbi:MAG: hypothetical protein AAF439_15235, partial [Pseudomonadota bacterium]
MSKTAAIAEKLAADWAAKAHYERLTGDLLPADITEAYAAQGALQRLLTAKRGPIAGRKIALASKAMQEMVGLDTPIAGAIFANDVFDSPAEVPLERFVRLGLEYELAFEMSRDIAPGDGPFSADNVLELVAAVRPAFELIDDRAADYADLCPMTLAADNAWCGGIVLGPAIDDWQSLDLGDLPSVLHQDGQPPEDGNTGAADPIGSLIWVLSHFAERGETIRKGEHIITGSVLRTRFPVPDDVARH